MFCGPQSHASSCRDELQDLKTLVSFHFTIFIMASQSINENSERKMRENKEKLQKQKEAGKPLLFSSG